MNDLWKVASTLLMALFITAIIVACFAGACGPENFLGPLPAP